MEYSNSKAPAIKKSINGTRFHGPCFEKVPQHGAVLSSKVLAYSRADFLAALLKIAHADSFIMR
jgi:hypothetical protein